MMVKGKNEGHIWGEAQLEGRTVARLSWSLDGGLIQEMQCDAHGKAHGFELEYDDSGRVIWVAQWEHGFMHGPAIQLDENGSPIIMTSFDQGRGVDIWMSCGEVSEVREMVDGVPHGFVRWGEPTRPWEEEHFFQGKRHGIFRQWTEGNLEEGFPRFYVDDKPVSRSEYETARETEASLPPYRPEEDSNDRAMPQVVLDARKRAEELAAEFSLETYLRNAK